MAFELQTASDSETTDLQRTAPSDAISEIGQFCAFDWSPEPHYLSNDEVWTPDEFEDDPTNPRDISPLSADARKALLDLDLLCEKQDVAPRRIEIMQSWKANHYDRGYQFLLPTNNGWQLPGNGGLYSPQNQQVLSRTYHTNVYGEKKEIIVAALCRETPKVEFFPVNSEHGPDQEMAEVAEPLKDIWAKNNNLHKLQQDIASIFWNDDRCLLWTRYELNGEEFGYEVDEEPTVPETETNPPDTPTGTDGDNAYREANESPLSTRPNRKPRGRVVTAAFGKLDHMVPINVDGVIQMGSAVIYEDKDEAICKAQFPWMKEKIKGGGDGVGETEFARIARENVRQALAGQYVTGDALNRHCVVKHRYIRRAMFFDGKINEITREELLDKFPDGVVLVKAGTEFAFARNEGMDDHITIGHPFPGKGQNRRALGESLLPIQDYINELVALALDFAKRTVAKKWFDDVAFNMEAMKKGTNIPGSSGPFKRQPGVPVSELVFIEPTPTPQPWLITFIQWIITNLSEQISGALPSLFGAQISGQVGSEGVATQRDQAMQRQGCPWNSMQIMFACAAGQAVRLTARCTSGDITDVIPGKGPVHIKVNNLKGKVLCYPESSPDFPESASQKEQRVMGIVDTAIANPLSEFSKMVLDPKNLKVIQSAIRMKDFVIKGAASVSKQQAEFEILLRSGPQPNPMKLQLQAAIEQAKQGMAQMAANSLQTGIEPSPEEQQQFQQAPQMIAMLEQQLAQLPDVISTVKVRGDGSEDDPVEASVCFDWLNSADGRKFEYGTPEQQAAFQNVYTHWKEHNDAAKKLAAQNAPPPPPPKVSFSVPTDKMPPAEQARIVAAGGVPAQPGDFEEHQATELNREVAKKVIPDALYTSELHKPPQ